MPRFTKFIPFFLELETEYHPDGSVKVERDPHDRGGTTKFGIDQRSHPRIDIASLTKDDAIQIYRADWARLPCDELAYPFGEILMDVHQNGGPAAEWIQQALGKLRVDGWIGEKTIARSKELTRQQIEQAVQLIWALRRDRFERLAQNPGQMRFRRGWLSRNNKVRDWCLSNFPA